MSFMSISKMYYFVIFTNFTFTILIDCKGVINQIKGITFLKSFYLILKFN